MHVNFMPSNGCNTYSGYGRYELGLAKALERAGATLHLVPDPAWPTVVVGFADWLTTPHIAGTRRYLATLTESTLVSERWVDLINRHAAGVLLPTESLCAVYRDSGVTVPVYDIGYAVDAPRVVEPIAPRRRRPFRFLTYSYGDMRKGADLAIFAFLRCFRGDTGYELVVKAREGYDTTWLRAIQDEPQISVVSGVQGETAWANLLLSAHCFVFPSRAEGIGLPPREATLLGVPTIATEWLGMDDAARWCYPLPVRALHPAHYDEWEANREGALWAEPDNMRLAELMESVVDDYETAQMVALQGADYLRGQTWERVGERIVAALGIAEAVR